jgi:hypothetical protein
LWERRKVETKIYRDVLGIDRKKWSGLEEYWFKVELHKRFLSIIWPYCYATVWKVP